MIAFVFLPTVALAQGVYAPPHVVTHSCTKSPFQPNQVVCQTYVNGALQANDTTINGVPTHPHTYGQPNPAPPALNTASPTHSTPWNP
jgi:hypothetical protein